MTLVIPIIKSLENFRKQLNAILELVSTGVEVLTQGATSYTFALTDTNAYIRHNNASPITVTVPPQASVAWPDKAVIANEQSGVGQVTVAAGIGVTVNRAATLTARSAERYAVFQLIRTGLDQWTLFGALEAV